MIGGIAMSTQCGQAGTLESCDALVMVLLDNGTPGVSVALDGPSVSVFEEEIRNAVAETLSALKIVDATVTISERGALDCTLRARVETAALRALAARKGIGDR